MSEYICRVIDLVAELAQEQDSAVLCHPQEPVVRCKGCKYFVTLSDDSKPTLLVCDLDGHVIDEQHFCGWGKPREGSDK